MSGFQLAPGAIFARDFRVIEPLSEGGMGAVYVAEQLSTQARRALKLMHPQLVRDPGLRARFEQEATVVAQIPSDHVVQVIAAGVDAESGMPWLAMELLDGTDLSEAVATGRCGSSALREIMEQLCHGLSAAHERGVVHRDLKPENVFLAAPRRPGVHFTVKILDFGIAKVTEQARAPTATAALGTPLWMAPEQAGATGGTISPATDIWALGLIGFWLLTGRSYWKGATSPGVTLESLMREVLFDPLPPASERAHELGFRGAFPPGFDSWFARAVQRTPGERFQDAGVAFEALSQALAAPPPSGNEFSDAATAYADAPRMERATTPKTVDDIPPLRLATVPGFPAAANLNPAPPAVVPQPTPAAAFYHPAPTPNPEPPHYPPAAGYGYAATSAASSAGRGRATGFAWGLATLAVIVAGVGAALILTREDWQPYLEAALEPEATTAPPPPSAPSPTPVCPPGTRPSGGRCVAWVDRSCPSGLRFEEGKGCVAIVATPSPPVQPAPLPMPTKAPTSTPTPAPTPAKKTATLSIDCVPSCDSVRINGVEAGHSPIIRRVVPTGQTTVFCKRAGYQSSSLQLILSSGASVARRVNLIPLKK
ncbi:MAG: serine/threonine protein kinase [Myxococcales bacterium]|nr:serine/threonine protein kinase [Myxococcales bacterium]